MDQKELNSIYWIIPYFKWLIWTHNICYTVRHYLYIQLHKYILHSRHYLYVQRHIIVGRLRVQFWQKSCEPISYLTKKFTKPTKTSHFVIDYNENMHSHSQSSCFKMVNESLGWVYRIENDHGTNKIKNKDKFWTKNKD